MLVLGVAQESRQDDVVWGPDPGSGWEVAVSIRGVMYTEHRGSLQQGGKPIAIIFSNIDLGESSDDGKTQAAMLQALKQQRGVQVEGSRTCVYEHHGTQGLP